MACVSENGLVSTQQVKGSINTEIFATFIDNLKVDPGTVILLDNVKFHHSLKVKEVAQRRNLELLFTPPYSPWFNPIELCFSIIKRHFYKHNDIHAAINSLQPSHTFAFFKKAMNCTGL